MKNILALDLGSTWIKAGVFDPEGQMVSVARRRSPDLDTLGCFDPELFLARAMEALHEASNTNLIDSPAALVCTSQRATTLVVDASGNPLTPAASWQVPVRGSGPGTLRRIMDEQEFSRRTGLPWIPIFPVMHLADPSSIWSRSVAQGGIPVSLADFLLMRLGGTLATDESLAGTSGLWNLHHGTWDTDLVQLAGLCAKNLPPVLPTGSVTGHLKPGMARSLGLDPDIPLLLGGSDQACAFLGSAMDEPGVCVAVLGTSAALLAELEHKNPGQLPIRLPHVRPGRILEEGFIGVFGTILGRMANPLGFASPEELVAAAGRVTIPDTAPICHVPNLLDHDAPDFGFLTSPAAPALTAALVLEGLAFEITHLVSRLNRPPQELCLCGNVSRSRTLTAMIAELVEGPVSVAPETESSLRGAALLALEGTGCPFPGRKPGNRAAQNTRHRQGQAPWVWENASTGRDRFQRWKGILP